MAVAHHVLLLPTPTPQKEFQFLQVATLGSRASQSSHTSHRWEGECSLPRHTHRTGQPQLTHHFLRKASRDVPTFWMELATLPLPHMLPSNEGQTCMSRSWSLPQVSPICLLALMECQESRWRVLVLLTLDLQPWIGLWHTVSAQWTTAG